MVFMSTVSANDGAINVKLLEVPVHILIYGQDQAVIRLQVKIFQMFQRAHHSLIINDGLCNPVVLNFNLTAPLPLLIQEDTASTMDILCFAYLTEPLKLILHNKVGPYDYLLTLQGGGTISSIL
jgi:hypothetical protein